MRPRFVLILIALMAAPAQTQTVYYAHTDILGNVVAVTDKYRNVVERRVYEPYGLPNTPIIDGPGFTGHDMDGDTGLVYMQQRYYDPQAGRFLSVDPVVPSVVDGSNFNRYWYADNNPYAYVDPDGRHSAKAHDRLLSNALQDRISADDLAVVQEASREFDRTTQGANQSHMHSMAREGEPTSVAKGRRDSFVEATLTEARSAAESGNRMEALTRFGEAMHPVMDSSSSDWLGNETSKHLTPAVLESQATRINAAYDWVFKEGTHADQ